MSHPTDVPRRVMGLWDLVLFYVVTGVSLRWIATAAAIGPSAVVVWLLAWSLFFLPLAFSVMEMSTRYPQEGGLYVWSKLAFGEFAGFMTGWTYWASNLPYFPAVLYFTASNALFIGGARWQFLAASAPYYIGFALLGLALTTGLNLVGLNVGKWLHNVGGLGTWIPIALLFVIAGVAWSRFGPANEFSPRTLMPSMRLQDLVFWSTIFFAFGGSEAASFMAEEIKNPRRTMPRGLLIGGTLVTVGYIGGTIAVLVALPQSEVTGLAGIMQAITRGADRIGVGVVAPLAAVLILASNLGAVGAWLAASARIPFVAGIDRFLPPAFGRLHPRWGTPYVSILIQAALGALFIFLGQVGTSVKGAYDVLVSMGVIAYFIPYLFVFASMIKLQAEPAGPEVIRVPGGKPVAILLGVIGLMTTSLTILLSLLPPPDEPNKALAVLKIVGLSVLLLGVGAGIYLMGRKRAHPDLR